jgi:hypothetical protein
MSHALGVYHTQGPLGDHAEAEETVQYEYKIQHTAKPDRSTPMDGWAITNRQQQTTKNNNGK